MSVSGDNGSGRPGGKGAAWAPNVKTERTGDPRAGRKVRGPGRRVGITFTQKRLFDTKLWKKLKLLYVL